MKKLASVNSATFAVCTGLVASILLACGGDDSAVPVPGADSGADAADAADAAHASDGQSSVSGEASSDASSSAEASSDASASGEASSDASSSDASSSGIGDSSTNDALPDSNAGDAFSQPSPDAAASGGGGDADASPPPQLEMCQTLDVLWGINTDAGADAGGCDTMTSDACPDRVDAWVGDIEDAFGEGPATTDCRTFEMFLTTDEGGVLSSDQQDDWENGTLPLFILDFFGCPVPGADAGALASYGVIPAALVDHVFTSADLSLVSLYFSQAVQAAVANLGAGSLTGDQIAAIDARLAYLQTTVSYVNSPRYSLADTCPEAGPDASSDDASADGGSD
jgi:hypothetical protein